MKPAMRMLAMERLREGDRPPRSEYGGGAERRMIGYDRDDDRGRRPQEPPYGGWPPEMRYGGWPDRIRRPPMDNYDRDDEPEMRRRRDRRGRFMTAGMDDMPEARRRRDRNGHYAAYGMDDDDDDDERPRMMHGNSYGDIYAEGTIYAPGAMNRPDPRGGTKGRRAYGPVTEEQAMEWVKDMRSVNNIPMPVFRPEAAEAQRKAICPDCDKWEFFVALNAMYADYQTVGAKYGDKPEFYAMLAKAFLEDPDAGDHKLQKYMECIPA